MIRLGLTGSIAMGKSTTAKMFREAGAWVHDADEAVHRLYAPGGAAVPGIGRLAPEAIVDGAVDRQRLSALLRSDTMLLKQIEELVHPLVMADRELFLEKALKAGVQVVVFDMPLLFETASEQSVDAVVVVTAPEEIQQQRALSRPNMTLEKLKTILSRQMPDLEKQKRADYIIQTGEGVDVARAQVDAILNELLNRSKDTD